MRREVPAILLLIVGGALLRITLGGSYLNYVKASTRPFLLVTAAVLLVLGALTLLDVVRGRSADVHAPKSAWLLLLPVAAVFLIAPGPLGAFSAARETSMVAAPTAQDSGPPPLPAGDPVAVPLDEYAIRAVWDDGRTLAGRQVQLVGFVTPDVDGGWILTRMSVACCAADAVPTKVKPVGEVPDLPANTWVEVTGTYGPGGGTQSTAAVPWVAVKDVQEIPAPANPYL